MKKPLIICAIALLAFSATASADEGMWLVNMIESRLHKQMAECGLKLDSKTIYDESQVSLSDAVVSLAFSCSGSMISEDGLMITNHHCAYADLHALSTTEKNYLEDGFRAADRSQEMPAPSANEGIYFLKKVIDVTEETMFLRDSLHADKKPMAMRKISGILEKRYLEKLGGEGEVLFSSYWAGSRYMVAQYVVYHDVRLVAAPPVSLASFGGEVDNWEWPQQKADFTIYRIYTAPDGSPAKYSPDNVPLHPKRTLKIATGGVHEGDYVMVMGFPGSTDRYCSPFAVRQTKDVVNPVQAYYKGEQMKILDKWMNKDPEIRLKYADHYFMLTNVQEIREGEVYCYNRFNVPQLKYEAQTKPLQEWIDADPERKARMGEMIPTLEQKYKDMDWYKKQHEIFKETYFSGYHLNRSFNPVLSLCGQRLRKKDSTAFCVKDDENAYRNCLKKFDSYDIRVERERFIFSIMEFCAHVDRQFWGDYISEMYDKFDGNAEAVASYCWDNSLFIDKEKMIKAFAEPHTPDFYLDDPLAQISKSSSSKRFNDCKDKIEKGKSLNKCENEYRQALYNMRLDKGIPQYADANSTMRITYGKVCTLSPKDAVKMDYRTTSEGILEKYNPNQYIFTLKPKAKELFEKRDWGRWGENGKMYVNFLSDCDITGGNSGSPVMDARGNLVGLAFDGNKEGLAGDTWFDTQMNKTISVDIRYVLWIVENYLDMGYLFDELTFDKGSFDKTKRRNADRK